jgi:hypothetical protein
MCKLKENKNKNNNHQRIRYEIKKGHHHKQNQNKNTFNIINTKSKSQYSSFRLKRNEIFIVYFNHFLSQFIIMHTIYC